MHIKNLLSSLVIVGGLLLGSALPQLQAEDELHRAIEKYGRNSERANHERRELRAARERCWRERHRWWDEHEHRWHTERDWDEHDHDRDKPARTSSCGADALAREPKQQIKPRSQSGLLYGATGVVARPPSPTL